MRSGPCAINGNPINSYGISSIISAESSNQILMGLHGISTMLCNSNCCNCMRFPRNHWSWTSCAVNCLDSQGNAMEYLGFPWTSHEFARVSCGFPYIYNMIEIWSLPFDLEWSSKPFQLSRFVSPLCTHDGIIWISLLALFDCWPCFESPQIALQHCQHVCGHQGHALGVEG